MRPLPPFRPLKLGQPLKVEDLNAQLMELLRLGRLQVAGDAQLEQSAGGPLLTVGPFEVGFWAAITARDGYRYTAVEQRPITGGAFEPLEHGRRVYCYESGNNANVPVGAVVWLERGFLGIAGDGTRNVDYRFEYCCGDDGGSGSGSGSTDIYTNACGSVVRTLAVTVSVLAGADPCGLDGTVINLTYDAAFGAVAAGSGLWVGGNDTICPNGDLIIGVGDSGGGAGSDNMEIHLSMGSLSVGSFSPGGGIAVGSEYNTSGDASTCDPLDLSWALAAAPFGQNLENGCCGSSDASTILGFNVVEA